MITRVSFARNGRCVLQMANCPGASRSLATAASGGFSYETGESEGVKFASRDLPGPTTHLAVVAKAGTRFQPLPGFSDGLEKFAYKNTYKRSSLRITRESELLGAELSSSHSRENLVISAKFLRDDLPYFAELLGEVITKTKYLGMPTYPFPLRAMTMLTSNQLTNSMRKSTRSSIFPARSY